MILTTYCKSCKENIKIKSNAITRAELELEKGDEFTINCLNCGKTEKKHVNEIRAKPSKLIISIGLIFGVLATIILWQYFGLIGTITFSIPIIFWQQQIKETKTFNSFLIRRK